MVEPGRTAARRPRATSLAVLAVVGAALVSASAYQSMASSSATASSIEVLAAGPPGALGRPGGLVPDPTAAPSPSAAATRVGAADSHTPAALGEADGLVPDGTTVFDGDVPAVANLDPALRRALRQAATDAAHDGIELFVDSGWRSAAYQDQLRAQAISTYGSAHEAARWVSTAATSAHVTGDAVDIGHADARAWLSRYGATYGLCQIYRNEPWHFELRPGAIDQGCPPMYADPTRDPRTRQ